jgi:hypothetical protein
MQDIFLSPESAKLGVRMLNTAVLWLFILNVCIWPSPLERVWIVSTNGNHVQSIWCSGTEPSFILALSQTMATARQQLIPSTDTIPHTQPNSKEESTDHGNVFTFSSKNKTTDCILGGSFFIGSFLITYFSGIQDYQYYNYHILRDKVGTRSLVDAEAGSVWCLRLTGIYLGFKGMLEYLLEKIDLIDYSEPINYTPFDLFEYLKEKEKKQKEKDREKDSENGKPQSLYNPNQYPPALELIVTYDAKDHFQRKTCLKQCSKYILRHLSLPHEPLE